jgi:hypothetical protein
MRNRARTILAVLLLLAVASPVAAEPPKDTMVIGLVAEPVTMDPPQITDLNSTRVAKRIFEGLTAQELGSYARGSPHAPPTHIAWPVPRTAASGHSPSMCAASSGRR